MTDFVALLRAVNVGGTGMMPMERLRALCVELGLEKVRTYIQSGNVVFESQMSEAALVAKLEGALSAAMGKPLGVLIRTGAEMQAILTENPFREVQPAQVGVLFLPAPAPADLLDGLVIAGREEVRLHGREIFIHYPDGMGRSKLKLPLQAARGTTRNLNTVAKLAVMVES